MRCWLLPNKVLDKRKYKHMMSICQSGMHHVPLQVLAINMITLDSEYPNLFHVSIPSLPHSSIFSKQLVWL